MNYAEAIGLLPTGKTVTVDRVYGSDATGAREGFPFATIAAALAAAQSGDVVSLRPGVYPEAGLVIPAGVALVGPTNARTFIQKTVTADTVGVTMGASSRIESLQVVVSSTADVNITAVLFPGTTASSARLRDMGAIVNQSGAPGVLSTFAYGIHFPATASGGVIIPGVDIMRAFATQTVGKGPGKKRGVYIEGPVAVTGKDTNVIMANAGGVGDYIGIETAAPGASFSGRVFSIDGTSGGSDIKPTAGPGSIKLGDVHLVNTNAGGLDIDETLNPSLSVITFSAYGLMPPNATRFLRPGGETLDTNEIGIGLFKKAIVHHLCINCRVPPQPGTSIVVTVRRALAATPTVFADTVLGATMLPGQTVVVNAGVSFTGNDHDIISLRVQMIGNTQARDLVVQVVLF